MLNCSETNFVVTMEFFYVLDVGKFTCPNIKFVMLMDFFKVINNTSQKFYHKNILKFHRKKKLTKTAIHLA